MNGPIPQVLDRWATWRSAGPACVSMINVKDLPDVIEVVVVATSPDPTSVYRWGASQLAEQVRGLKRGS